MLRRRRRPAALAAVALAAVAPVAVALAAAGCAARPPGPIDPGSIRPAARFGPLPDPAPTARLRVITETTLSSTDDPPRRLHEGYDLFDEHGRFVRRVENHASYTDEGVETVLLPPGRYFAAIPGVHRPRHWIELRLEAGRLTEADVTGLAHARTGSAALGPGDSRS